MKKIIEKIFGKPYKNKMFKLMFGVVFYIIGAALMIIINFSADSKKK